MNFDGGTSPCPGDPTGAALPRPTIPRCRSASSAGSAGRTRPRSSAFRSAFSSCQGLEGAGVHLRRVEAVGVAARRPSPRGAPCRRTSSASPHPARRSGTRRCRCSPSRTTSWPSHASGWRRASRTLFATTPAHCGSPPEVTTISPNSSPSSRAAMSIGPMHPTSRSPTRRSSASPIARPRASFTCLNRSMATKSAETIPVALVGPAERPGQQLAIERPVGQAGELVVVLQQLAVTPAIP